MNIAILTHPLGANYGGILQAFALSTYLKNKGFNVIVLNRRPNLPFIKKIIKIFLEKINHPRYNNPKYKKLIQFTNKYINYSSPLLSTHELSNYIKKNKIDYVIVGSDQVWRTSFSLRYGFNYFLDFVPSGVKKIAYAASFGLSKWEYSEDDTNKIIGLVNDFKSISVREDEGVILCKNYLGIKVEHVLDPTMLLRDTDYDKITSKRLIDKNYILVYWLGAIEEKNSIVNKFKKQNKIIIDISLRANEPLCSIEDWLSYIKYADYVVTDSFHGCVFSILFQKQFTVYSNISGGNSRLNSLLRMLDIDTTKGYIDYSTIVDKLNKQRDNSYYFINKSLQ